MRENPRTLTLGGRAWISALPVLYLALVVAGPAHAIAPATPGVCYGSTGVVDGGRLITIDPVTGAGTLIGDIVGIPAVPGLAINSAGDIYATDNLLDSNLYRIDATTGLATFVGDLGLDGPDGIAFDENDILYATETAGAAKLYTVNVTTAVPTLVGSLTNLPAGHQMTGLAFDPTDGTLYGSTGGPGTDGIYTIDKGTGAVTLVGTTGLGGSTPDLFFNETGSLSGSKGGGGNPNSLISIDKGTAAGIAIGPIGFVAVSGLDCFLPQVDVPTMNEWGAAVLVVLLVAGAMGFIPSPRWSSVGPG
jgi:hypothetical protein